jgi:hypothetical protein
MKQRIMQMAWGLFALSLIAGIFFTAHGSEPPNTKKGNMQTTGPMVQGVDFDGEFYPPQGCPKKLGVLVLGGSDGGIPSRRAMYIAEKGFPALALAYFKTRRTPEYLDMIPLEYFDQPIEWLKKKNIHREAEFLSSANPKAQSLPYCWLHENRRFQVL